MAVLSRVATWIRLDLDRLGTVVTRTLWGNHTLARVDDGRYLATNRAYGHRPALRCWLVDTSDEYHLA